MKTIGVISTELKKVIISPYFLIGVSAFTLMCFTSEAYYDGTKRYAVFDMIKLMGTDMAGNPEFSAENICQRGFGGWLIMFMGIIVSFPFVKVMCDERNYSEKRYIIARTGIFRYSFSKLISAVLSAAAICVAGYLLFTATVYMIFPKASEMGGEISEYLYITPYLKNILAVAITGAAYAISAYLICAFIRNQYLCICIPFLANHLYKVVLEKFMSDNIYDTNAQTSMAILNSLSPLSLSSFVYGVENNNYSIYIYAILFIIVLIIFNFMQRRNTDVGQ